MLKTNSKEVKNKIQAFILSEIKEEANIQGYTMPEYLRLTYTQAKERTKGTKETPAENLVNTASEFFRGDFEIFQIVQSWTESDFEPTQKNINKAILLYYRLLDREINAILKNS